MREDIMKRFGIGRHRLNDLLSAYADGVSFPQYINAIRMEEAYVLLTEHPGDDHHRGGPSGGVHCP